MGTDRKVSLPAQQFSDRQLGQLQREVNAVLKGLQALPFAGGCVDLGTVAITTAPIPHKLGRVPRGWLAYGVAASSGTAVSEIAGTRTDKTLTLTAPVPTTAGILVW